MSEVVGMDREVFCLDPKTSWRWPEGTLSESIFMTLADASNEPKSLVLLGALAGWGKRGSRKEKES